MNRLLQWCKNKAGWLFCIRACKLGVVKKNKNIYEGGKKLWMWLYLVSFKVAFQECQQKESILKAPKLFLCLWSQINQITSLNMSQYFVNLTIVTLWLKKTSFLVAALTVGMKLEMCVCQRKRSPDSMITLSVYYLTSFISKKASIITY